MPIDTFLPFLKDKFDDVTGEGSFDVEINVPLESITRDWLEALAGGSVTYVVGMIDEGEYDDEIRLRVHTYDIPVQIPTPPVYQQPTTTPIPTGKIRVYQTYMDDTDRATPLIGKPLAVHKFIEYVKHEYRTAQEIMWDDIRVPMEDITREWLEGLAVDSQTELIGSEGEDLWLRVHVYELDIQELEDTATNSEDTEDLNTPVTHTSKHYRPKYGYAVMFSIPYSGCCGKGFRLSDVMECVHNAQIYTDEQEFIDCVNEVIANEIYGDCEQFECGGDNDNYCCKPHETLHTYPHGTDFTVDDLKNISCFDRDTDPEDITIISEPDERYRDNKTTVWICKFRLS